MVKKIHTEIDIEGTPEEIWEVLMDFESYTEWNPFIKSIKGDNKVGSRLEVVLEPVGKSPMTFKPKVQTYKENQRFVWIGRFILPKIFDGEHSFELISNGQNFTKFIHSEKFSGILTPLFNKLYRKSTVEGFKLMNQALKVFVEN